MSVVGDWLELSYGKALKESDRDGGPVPVVGSGGVVGGHSSGLTSGPTIVVGRKGSIGSVTWVEGPAWPIDTAYFVSPRRSDLDMRWTFWMLQSLGMGSMNKSAAVPGLNRDDVYRLQISVPPLEEQKRTAATLDRADAIGTKRRQVHTQLYNLTESIFHAMFGDTPAIATVAEVGTNIRTGPFGSQLLHSEFVEAGIAVLGLDNVVGNEFRWAERRYITPTKYEQLKRYTVHPGDVLISIMGTTGRCVIVPDAIPTAINTKHICAITADPSRVEPFFLRASFLWHPESREHLRRQTKGSIMDGLNMGIIKAMPIPTPSLDRQKEFGAHVAAIESERALVECALAADAELFASLRSGAFGGDL
jgi:type I restriction enzyme, S subunit